MFFNQIYMQIFLMINNCDYIILTTVLGILCIGLKRLHNDHDCLK